jgi:hypothetical protein
MGAPYLRIEQKRDVAVVCTIRSLMKIEAVPAAAALSRWAIVFF